MLDKNHTMYIFSKDFHGHKNATPYIFRDRESATKPFLTRNLTAMTFEALFFENSSHGFLFFASFKEIQAFLLYSVNFRIKIFCIEKMVYLNIPV